MNKQLTILFLLATTVCQAQSQISAQDALKLASQNRPALAAARLRVEEARATAKSLGALSPLELAVGASSRNDVGATDQDLALTQGIDLFGRQRSAKALGAAGVERALAAYRAEASELQAEVLTAFAEAVSARHQSEVSNELLTVAEGLFNATKRRFDEGKVAELQVTRASIELERAKQASELRRADFAAAIKRLSGLLGARADTLNVEPDASIEVLTSPTVDQRPDLLELKAEVLIAEAEAKVASVSNRPEFSLQLVRSPWGNDRGYFVGRAQITWAIFDHGRARNESRAASLKAEAARKQLLDSTTKAKLELEATKIEIDARQARIQRYEAILGSARELVAKSQKGFSEGFGTQIDVLEATRALREVEQELVEARQQLSLAVIDQYKASGFLAEVLK
ncbi:MAG: TolC family protein [Armatimonadetes bacterium]|nr:TolC family protein [Armatimonadota bacterium]MBX3114579.1 TolC family protein [Fimbriimonadaceae bacterium]